MPTWITMYRMMKMEDIRTGSLTFRTVGNDCRDQLRVLGKSTNKPVKITRVHSVQRLLEPRNHLPMNRKSKMRGGDRFLTTKPKGTYCRGNTSQNLVKIYETQGQHKLAKFAACIITSRSAFMPFPKWHHQRLKKIR